MIPNGEKRHYLAVKKLTVIYGHLYCLNYLYSFVTENKLESHKKVCEDKVLCNVIMPFEYTKISEFNQYQKADAAPFIIYVDLECIMEMIDGCKNNPEISSTTKAGELIASGFSLSTVSSFKTENKQDVQRCKDCMKKFCGFLTKQVMKNN